MRRLVASFVVLATTLLLLAPVALAEDHGQGTAGNPSDKTITDAGFIVIGLFPFLILVFSLIQWRLDARKERRKAGMKKLAADWRGGW
jgi:hypothetical protein